MMRKSQTALTQHKRHPAYTQLFEYFIFVSPTADLKLNLNSHASIAYEIKQSKPMCRTGEEKHSIYYYQYGFICSTMLHAV